MSAIEKINSLITKLESGDKEIFEELEEDFKKWSEQRKLRELGLLNKEEEDDRS